MIYQRNIFKIIYNYEAKTYIYDRYSNVNYNIFNCYNGNNTRIIIMDKKKTIKLPIGNIIMELSINDDGQWGGIITSDLKEKCPCCKNIDCYDFKHYEDYNKQEDISYNDTSIALIIKELYLFNSITNGIESVILAHACAGIDIESPAYLEGIETAINAIT